MFKEHTATFVASFFGRFIPRQEAATITGFGIVFATVEDFSSLGFAFDNVTFAANRTFNAYLFQDGFCIAAVRETGAS